MFLTEAGVVRSSRILQVISPIARRYFDNLVHYVDFYYVDFRNACAYKDLCSDSNRCACGIMLISS
jgi:hypothetical protein